MRLVVDSLSAERGGEIVFSDISFAIESGEALIVTGANGVGKSTLLRAVAGLLPSHTGRIDCSDLPGEAERLAEAAHYLGHRNALKPELTVRENLEFWRDFTATGTVPPSAETVQDALRSVGLVTTAELPVAYLSAGQQRRVALARLLVAARRLWILDEPTSALDANSERAFETMLESHLGKGGIALVATHLPLSINGSRTLAMEPTALLQTKTNPIEATP